MTQPVAEPVPYYTPWQPVFVRPTAVSVIAWIGLVWGALGVICGGVGLLMGQLVLARLSAAAGLDTSWNRGQLLGTVVGVVQSLVLLIASLGCLYLRPAARRVMMGYAIFTIAWSVGMIIMRITMPRNAGAAAQGGAVQAMVIAINLTLAWGLPVAILIIMTRPRVRSAFASGGVAWYPSSYGYQQPTYGALSGNDRQTP